MWIANNDVAWHALCHYWSLDELKAKVVRQSSDHGTRTYHKYGGDDRFRLSKQIVSSTDSFCVVCN